MNRFDYRFVRQMMLFAAVADAGSVSKAARMLTISAPPIITQLNELETRVGVKLLNRTKRGITLTPAGRCMLPSIRRMVSQVEAVDYTMRLLDAGSTGIVKIGAVYEAMIYDLPSVIRKIRKENPGVTIFTEEIHSNEAVGKLVSGEMDLVIGFFMDFREECLASATWRSESPMVLLPSDSALSGRKSLTLNELSESGWIAIGTEKSLGFRKQSDRLFEAAGYVPRVSQTVESINRAIAFVACGQGIALIPESYGRSLPDAVTAVALEGGREGFTLRVAWNREIENPLRDLILAEAETLSAKGTQ